MSSSPLGYDFVTSIISMRGQRATGKNQSYNYRHKSCGPSLMGETSSVSLIFTRRTHRNVKNRRVRSRLNFSLCEQNAKVAPGQEKSCAFSLLMFGLIMSKKKFQKAPEKTRPILTPWPDLTPSQNGPGLT